MPEEVKDQDVQEPLTPPTGEPSEPEEAPAPIVEPPTEEPTQEPPATLEARRRSAQRRIDELTRQKHDALREAEYWRSKAGQAPSVESKPSMTREPQPDDYDTQEDYIRAAARWEAYQVHREAVEHNRAQQAEVERGEVLNKFERQLVKARQTHEDFDDVIAQPVFTPAMQQAIFESEVGAEVAYYLGTHEEEALRIAQLSPLRAIKEIAKLEVRLTPGTPQPRRVSTAPLPITPLKGGAPVLADPTKMTAQEYWEAKQAGLIS